MFKKRGLPLLLVVCIICTLLAGMPLTVSAAVASPASNIYDADVLPNGDIAAVYINGGNVYYGIFSLATGQWITENIGTGKDAALALDTSGKPHVAYINMDDDLVYKYFNGTGWSPGDTLDSFNVGGPGLLTCPDIAVDGSGSVHISYNDSKGGYQGTNNYEPYEIDDLIYATNSGGAFARTVRSYSQGWFSSPDGWRNWAMAPSKIALASGSYYIGIKQYGYSKWMGGQDHTYSYNLLLPPADPSNDKGLSINSSSINNDFGFILYDMGSYGANVYSLYKKSGELNIINGITTVPGAAKAYSPNGADLFVNKTDGSLYYAAINGTNLLLYQNGQFKENLVLPATISGSHQKIATVVAGNYQYVLYTDTNGLLRTHAVSTVPDSTAPAWLASLPSANDISTDKFKVNAGINEPGTVYYIVVDRDAAAPVSAEVKAGINYGSVTKRASGSFAVLGNIPDFSEVTGLNTATGYDVYLAAQDNEGNLQSQPVKLQVTTSSPTSVGLTDSDADHVYFGGDALAFNVNGLDALNGQTARVAFGTVGQNGTFTPTAVIGGLTASDNGVQQFAAAAVSGGNFSTDISGTVQDGLGVGTIAVQIYMDADGPGPGNTWNNILAGQPTDYMVLTAGNKPAITGISLPEGIGSMPVLGEGLQTTENLYNIDIVFQKTIASGITGKISFSGLDLIGNKEQLALLSTGLTMLKEAEPGAGNLEKYTMGVNTGSLTFLANVGAVVSVTSPSFNGRAGSEFVAAAADAGDGQASGLSFDDTTDTVTFTVNHFSNYSLSLVNSADANGDGYYDGDVAALVAFLEQPAHVGPCGGNPPHVNGDKNGKVVCSSPDYNPSDPSTFDGVTWTVISGLKRVTGICWDSTHGYHAGELSGSFDARQLTELTSLTIADTEYNNDGGVTDGVISVQVAGLTKLETLNLNVNALTSLDVSGCTALTTLDCQENKISSLNFTGVTQLTRLNCGYNALQSLNINGLSKLEILWCYGNQLSNLDVSGFTLLKELDCQDNNLTTLDVSANTALTKLYCGENSLGSLDVSNHTALAEIDCYSSNLSSINVSGCIALNSLYCKGNNLESLNLTGLTALQYLNCDDNKLAFSDLPIVLPVSGGIYVYAPQKSVPIALTSGNTVDLSSEKTIDGTETTFTWFNSLNEQITTGINETNGIFTFDRAVYEGKAVYCVMANTKFNDFSGQNALKTTQVTIQGIPALPTITDLSVSGTTVSWPAVANASGYTVNILKGGVTVSGYGAVPVSLPSIDLVKFDGGVQTLQGGNDYTVKVTAKGNGSLYADSAESAASAGITVPLLPWEQAITDINAAINSDAVKGILDIQENRNNFGASATYVNAYVNFTAQEKTAVAAAVWNNGADYAVATAGKTALITAYETACKQVYINRAKVIIGITFTAVEGIDSNILSSLNALAGMSATGVTLSVAELAGTLPITVANGNITYNTSTHTGSVRLGLAYDGLTTEHTITTVNIPAHDTVAPAAGGSPAGTITATSVTTNSLVLNWVKATDAAAPQSKLKYYIIKSTSDNISDLAGMEANGVLLNQNGTADISTYTVTGLSASTKYYFNVGVSDLCRNYTAYTAVSVTTAAAPAGNGGNGGSGNPSTPSAPATPATPSTPPVVGTSSGNGNTTTATAAVKPQTDETTGTASAKIEANVADELANKAKEAETAGKNVVVEIKVEAADNLKAVEVEIPREAFNKIADNTEADVKVNAGLGAITFDTKAVESISDAAGAGNISVSIQKVEASALIDKVREKIGDRPVFDFSVKAGNTEISTFGEGSADISIPYSLKPGEDKNAIIVYYIDNSGVLKTVRGKYNPQTGTVDFRTAHFSQYAVGYNKVSFKDVADNAWYGDAVEFIAARGITEGTGNGKFSPGNKLTRGQFIVMIMRAYGMEADANPAANFSDAGNTYYTGYLGAAKRLCITDGIGSNLYAPEREISRQEMFTLLYRTLKILGELPEGTIGKPLSSFSDSGKVADYAREAMTLFTRTGTISGSGGKLAPASASTRAEMAQILYNLLSK